jgi:hypothetical protein
MSAAFDAAPVAERQGRPMWRANRPAPICNFNQDLNTVTKQQQFKFVVPRICRNLPQDMVA